jgi:hypothetical protein
VVRTCEGPRHGCRGPFGGGGRSRREDVVEESLGLVLVGVLGECQLGDQDLPRLREHPLLPGRETTVPLAAPQVTHDLGHLHHVTRVQLLEVRLVAAGPVRGLLGVLGPQHVEDPVQSCLVHHVAHADQVEVARGDSNHQILLGDDPEHEVLPVLALDLAHLDVLDDRRAVIWVYNCFADNKCHM